MHQREHYICLVPCYAMNRNQRSRRHRLCKTLEIHRARMPARMHMLDAGPRRARLFPSARRVSLIEIAAPVGENKSVARREAQARTRKVPQHGIACHDDVGLPNQSLA